MTPSGTKWHRHELWLLLAISLLSAGLIAARLNEAPIGAVTDDAYYVEMARSVAQGLGPILNVGPDTPAANPGIFPVGFPYLLSPLARWWPASLAALKAVPLLATLMLLPLCLWLPGPTADNRLRLALAAVVMLNPWVIAWGGRILSDNPYAALSLGALLLFARLPQPEISPRVEIIAGVLLAFAAVSVRTIGWALVLGTSAYFVTQRQWRRALVLPVSVGLLTLLLPGKSLLTPAYTTQMFHHSGMALWRFMLQNSLEYVAELPVILLPIFGAPVAGAFTRIGAGMLYPAAAFITGTLLLMAAGKAVVTRWRDPATGPRVRLMTFYLIFYAGALAQFDGYPSGVQVRLLIPVLPILAWLVLLGVSDLAGGFGRPLPLLVIALVLVSALGHNGWRLAHPLRTTVAANGNGLVDTSRGMAWLRRQEPALTMAEQPLPRHVHLQRPLVHYPDQISQPAVAKQIATYGVTHILVAPSIHNGPRRLDSEGRAMLAVLSQQPERFTLVHQDPADSVFVFLYRGN